MRPDVVQNETACASYCQLKHRSSYDCAASRRNVIGLDSALIRRFDFGLPRFPARMLACSVVYASRTFLITCCAACAPSPSALRREYVCLRSSYSRGTPWANATRRPSTPGH